MLEYESYPLESRTVWSISSLNAAAGDLLEHTFKDIWVEGEISNFSSPSSGHWYFSLKDESAQIRCAMFRGRNRLLRFTPSDGDHVLVKAMVSLYSPRGDYQLIITDLEERGTGALQRAYEKLKEKLQNAGLFSPEHKKKLPHFPKRIGVITSPTGAAIRDILSVLKRRFPLIPIVIYPAVVQGQSAASTIVEALTKAEKHNACDVLILARGGGSLEDLWPFNEEIVAHALFNCKIPIVSGVGHEVDFTIADFVADVRAPTPSAAAELVSPDYQKFIAELQHYHHHLIQLIKKHLAQKKLILNHIQQRIRHPQEKLQHQMQKLDFYEQRMVHSIKKIWQERIVKLDSLHQGLQKNPIREQIKTKSQQIILYQKQMEQHFKLQFIYKNETLNKLAAQLHALSPLAIFDRGYSATFNEKNQVLTSVGKIKVGEVITTQLKNGKIKSQVIEKSK